MKCSLDSLDYGKMGGLVPVVVAHAVTGEVLMQAYADRDAVERTLETGLAWFYSRSRRRLWMKGESSGNILRVLRVVADCDCDSLLYEAVPSGPVCHTGRRKCFHNPIWSTVEEELWRLILDAFRRARLYVREGRGGLDEYLYLVNPLTDNIPPPSPLLSSLLSSYLAERARGLGGDAVLAPEALGLPLASLVSARLGLPLVIARKRRYPVPGLSSSYTSGYEEGVYTVYGFEDYREYLLVDDAVSTGGTVKALWGALEESGRRITGVAAAVNKPQYRGYRVARELGLELVRAVDLYVYRDGWIRLVQPYTGWREELEVEVVRSGEDV